MLHAKSAASNFDRGRFVSRTNVHRGRLPDLSGLSQHDDTPHGSHSYPYNPPISTPSSHGVEMPIFRPDIKLLYTYTGLHCELLYYETGQAHANFTRSSCVQLSDHKLGTTGKHQIL